MPLIPVNLFWDGGVGDFLIMETKECACGIQNISSWFLVFSSWVWADAVNHMGMCMDHLLPTSIPWSALGIAFSEPLKWELIPQSSRSKWEQRINIHKVLGRGWSLQISPHCCWLWNTALRLWDLRVPQTNPIPNWNNLFLLFFSPLLSVTKKKKKSRIQGFLAQSNRAASVLGVTWALGRCGIWTSLLLREFSVLSLAVPHFQVCTEKLMGFFHKD